MNTRKELQNEIEVTVSDLEKILTAYRHKYSFNNILSFLGFANQKSPEEIEFERLFKMMGKHRKNDYLTLEEALLWRNYSFINRNHVLPQKITNLFAEFNQIYNSNQYNLLRSLIRNCSKRLLLSIGLITILLQHHEDGEYDMLNEMIENIWPLLSNNHLLTYQNSLTIHRLLMTKRVYLDSIITKCRDADSCGQLTQQYLDKMINMHYAKLPKVSATKIEFHDKKIKHCLNSYITKISDDTRITIENSKCDSGSFGTIKKGHSFFNGYKQSYIIKKLKKSEYPTKAEAIKVAKNEVKYHHLLKRQDAFYFVRSGKDTVYIVYPWQTGKPLHAFEESKLKLMPMKDRLYAFMTMLQELQSFHDLFRLHGDIHHDNILFNARYFTMSLIDFGLSRKKTGDFLNCNGTRKTKHNASLDDSGAKIEFNQAYLDSKHPSHFSFNGDVYALSFILAELFPDLFTIDSDQEVYYRVTKTEKNHLLPIKQAIYHLFDAMQADYDMRSLVSDLFLFCQEITSQTELRMADVERIANKTLLRTELTINDALHERTKPLSFNVLGS